MDYTFIDVDINRGSQSWISLLRVGSWNALYLEWSPRHAGGGIAFLTILGIRII